MQIAKASDHHSLSSLVFALTMFGALALAAGLYALVRQGLPASEAFQFGAGLAVFPSVVGLASLLVFRSRRGRARYEVPTIVSAGLLLFSLTGFQPNTGVSTGQSTPGERASPEIRVVVSRQDAEGITQEQLSQAFLGNLERYTLHRANASAALALRAHGDMPSEMLAAGGAVYLEIDGRKLAIVRLRGPGGSQQSHIVGIMGPEVVRVVCSSEQAFPVTSGPCGDRIQREFTVRF